MTLSVLFRFIVTIINHFLGYEIYIRFYFGFIFLFKTTDDWIRAGRGGFRGLIAGGG
jgi:hypothetical protein